jgi:asparagine synthase (glutamine-hydrolysing)|tara:strand:- start:399 stop:929 length:531 start_codon:yes stop_codon:yes gene_type:complete
LENSEKIINPIWVIINIKTGRLLNSNKKFTNITYDGWIDTLPNKKLEYSGDAALIKYDEKKLTTTVIRDYFGIHQVFYVIKNNKVHISTSITGLVQSGLKIKPSVKKNILFVASHYRYFEFPENSSFFEDVYSLRPGECLIVKNGKITKKKHFSVKIIKSYEKYEMKELEKFTSNY